MRAIANETEETTAAFGALAEASWGRAFAVAVSIVRDAHEAEEVVQEALLRAFENLGALRDHARFGPWLARIVQNEARARLRRRRPRVTADGDLSRVAARRPVERERIWTDPQVAAALGSLTYNQRVVVTLRFLLELEPREISAFLGLSPGSVRKRLHDGLARLRRLRLEIIEPLPDRARMPPARKENVMNRIPNVLSRILEARAESAAEKADPGPPLVMNLMDRLLEDRIVFLSGRIDQDVATSVTAQLLFLQRENRDAPVHLYVSSPGGDLFAGLGVYDTMRFLACPVHTYAIGQASGVAALILAAGEPGARFLLPNAAVMLHQPPVGESGGLQEHFQEAAAARFRGKLVQLLGRHSGSEEDRIERDLTRGVYLTAEEARDYGLADEVV